MILIERHQITQSHPFFDECDKLSYIMKNLYNTSLYKIRTGYFNSNKVESKRSFNVMLPNGLQRKSYTRTSQYHLMKSLPEFDTKSHSEYGGYACNTKILKQVFIQIENIFKSYFKALSSYKRNPAKFTGKPKLPSYKDKNGRCVVTIPKDALSKTDFDKLGTIGNAKLTTKITPYKATYDNVKELKIVPRNGYYEICISYEVTEKQNFVGTPTKLAGIDLGINNLMAVSFNDTGSKPFLINGRHLKSINQYYNKQVAHFKSLLPQNTMWSNRLSRMTRKRNNKIRTELHKATTYVINELIKNGVQSLVVGWNAGIKRSISLGRVNNQNFTSIPFYTLRKMLEYKCKLAGINYVETEESFTSKSSFLDMESMSKGTNFTGKRIQRGLFETINGVKINSDINGSLNILRKVAGNLVFKYTDTKDLVEGFAVSPLLIHVQ